MGGLVLSIEAANSRLSSHSSMGGSTNVCLNILSEDRDKLKFGSASLATLLACIVSVLASLTTIFWIRRNQISAQKGNAVAVKSVIFPVFVKILWLTVFVYLFYAGTVLFVRFPIYASNSISSAVLYALNSALQHGITEGIAFLLLQKGCGNYAAKSALKYTVVWMITTFATFFFVFRGGFDVEDIAYVVSIFWDGCLSLFYLILWLCPRRRLFRRPAAILYARFWSIFRLISIAISCLEFYRVTTDYADCGYLFLWLIAFPCLQPLISYWTLLRDSRWWQGFEIRQGRRKRDDEEILTPLLGSDFTLECAQSLADTLDQIKSHHQVKMVNFACIKVDVSQPLGSGSFSKVYRGSYRNQACAVKLIYTMDLTVDVIQRVAAEASILSSLQHPNVVRILGVCVLPPSVCVLLELCSFGSLSDIIRGYGFNWNTSHKRPPTLSTIDKLHLALGCARGLEAVHALHPTLCHRDVKSFNFLVDSQLTAKIADLELGSKSMHINFNAKRKSFIRRGSSGVSGIMHKTSDGSLIGNVVANADNAEEDAGRESEYDGDIVIVEDLLANWIAPEVIKFKRFQQESDVFSLAVVLWEIIVGELPFGNEPSQTVIRSKVLAGYRHPLPRHSRLSELIAAGWATEPSQRPSAKEMGDRIEEIIRETVDDMAIVPELTVNTLPLTAFLERKHGVSRSTTSSWASDNSAFLYHTQVSGTGSDLLNNNNTSSNTGGVMHPMRVPQVVEDTVVALRALPCWAPLESQSGAWAILSPGDPFALLYWNRAWLELFSPSTALILATSAVCDGTLPVLALGDLVCDNTDLSVLSRFCVSLTRTGSGQCVLDLGAHVGMCSIHAFPLYSSGSTAAARVGASAAVGAGIAPQQQQQQLVTSPQQPSAITTPAPAPGPPATPPREHNQREKDSVTPTPVFTPPIKHAHSFGSVLSTGRNSFTAANTPGQPLNTFSNMVCDCDCIAVQFTALYDSHLSLGLGLSLHSRGHSSSNNNNYNNSQATNTTSPSVAAALNDLKMRQQQQQQQYTPSQSNTNSISHSISRANSHSHHQPSFHQHAHSSRSSSDDNRSDSL